MKKLSIVLFAVLFAAVACLFFLHFTVKKIKKSTKETSQGRSPVTGNSICEY